ncbi:SANT/Myb domain-containing protein [Hirschfeldia incana]|nr:SANT/Myb domain-containing protein [Hirschfeldia incana]
MYAQRRKWSAEEEEAFLAGVRKYGPGKWSYIINDPEFRAQLSTRSNIDLKDKWRNMMIKEESKTLVNQIGAMNLACAEGLSDIFPIISNQ